MIYQFRVSNFQSVREEISIDFRVPGTSPKLPYFRESPSRPATRVPTVIALFGANGSGKTTLLRSLVASLLFAAKSYEHPHYIGSFLPFFAKEKRVCPTRIEVELDGKWLSSDKSFLYRYTLEIARDAGPVPASPLVEHEAIHVFPKGRPFRLLERCRNNTVYVAKELKVKRSDPRLRAVPDYASAVSTLAKMGVEPFLDLVQDLRDITTNIAGSIPWKPEIDFLSSFYRDKSELVAAVSDKLQRLDLGIEGLEIMQATGNRPELVFRHCRLDEPVPLYAESAGARRLVQIFPLVEHVLKTGGIAVLDSLDSDFHTELVLEVLDWFRREDTNPNKAQLLCSLHNPSILDDLEKEEAYIVEKYRRDGVTLMYGLRDIQGLRRDVSLQRQYRGGSLGGLPGFG